MDLPIAITQKMKTKIHPPTWNLEEAMVTGKLFLDEIAEGIPLMNAPVSGGKMVDWKKIEVELEEKGII